MVSKGVTIGLVGLLVLALVGGSAYILLRPEDGLAAESGVGYSRASGNTAGSQGSGSQGNGSQGNGSQSNGSQGDGSQGNGSQGSGSQGSGWQGSGSQGSGSQATGRGQGAGGEQGQGLGSENGSAQTREHRGSSGEAVADHPSESWDTLTGSVIALDGDTLTMQTGDGPVAIHLGPEWYWESNGIAVNEGDSVEVAGFYEDGVFEAASVLNVTSGESVSLRDDAGRPLWAGRGNGRQGGAL